MADACRPHPDNPGPEWITLERLGKIIGKAQTQAREARDKLLESGAAEAKVFRLLVNGRLRPIQHIRLKRKPTT